MRRPARAGAALVAWLGASCAGPEAAVADPDWRGAPVHVRHLGDRGVEVEFVAPTAGHEFALREVVRRGARADLVFAHAPPTADLVAQVVTPLRVAVAPERLGDAAVVAVVIREGERSALAVLAARPR